MMAEEAINWIHERLVHGSRPGLQRVIALLDRVGHPETKVPTIHIAGTNGKGSTVTYLRCLLEEIGLTVGTFTSPYLVQFNERISINGQGISDQQLAAYVAKYQPLVAAMDQESAIAGITEFELLTVLALDYFAEEQVDIAIVEVGIGGLLDSTNVVQPMLTAITTIGKDHTEILGETLEAIAEQKAGIIKPGIPLVTGNIETEAFKVIEAIAKEKGSPVYPYETAYQARYVHPDPNWGEIFDFYNPLGKLSQLKTPLLGKHQIENAGLAIELFYLYAQMQHLPIQSKTIRQGLAHAKWPGRMEKLHEEPLILLDGAHNAHAMTRLTENMKQHFRGRSIHILFSALKTKDNRKMIQLLQTIPDSHLYITTFDYPKAIDLSEFETLTNERTTLVSLWQFGLAEMMEKMAAEDVLLVTGSLYFISQVRELFINIGGKTE